MIKRADNFHRMGMTLRAFVLLEVIISLTILGFSVAALMRSFTVSLKAARDMEIQTQSMFFASQLMDYFEIAPPSEGVHEGGFGDAYANYSYQVDVRYATPRYRDLTIPPNVADLYKQRNYQLRILYTDPKMTKPYTSLSVDSSIIGFEKFSYPSRMSYANF